MVYLPQRRRQGRQRSLKAHFNDLPRLRYDRLLFLIVLGIGLSWSAISILKWLLPSAPPAASDAVSEVSQEALADTYTVKSPPDWRANPDLQAIVDETVALAEDKGLPTEALSITLVDVTDPATHYRAGYNHQMLRFPASVSKLFWLAAFFNQVRTGSIPDESPFHDDLNQMIRISDNDSASRIVDAITRTTSGETLGEAELERWIDERRRIDTLFRNANYDNILLSMKNYPVTDLGEAPEGRDLQLKQTPALADGNQVSTDQAARLMYEIYTKQAVSPLASTKMAHLLTRDLNPSAWDQSDRDFVKGFLGESLPADIYFASKVGYTSRSRQEVIFVRTLDDRAIYILAIFATDPAYAQDEEIFPQMSRHIFDRLNGTSQKLKPKEVSVMKRNRQYTLRAALLNRRLPS
ncbi:MAG: serine hydrolase [Limnospira sp.]